MSSEITSKILGEFTGFNSGNVFRLVNGQVWQQKKHKYKYKYSYRPDIHIYKDQFGHWMMKVSTMDEAIEVVQVSIVEEGTIVSDFKGFDGSSKFTFSSGRVWEQAEYKYKYQYLNRPQAIVVDGLNGYELHIEGVDETVRVRRS
jgi:hypothetical protein